MAANELINEKGEYSIESQTYSSVEENINYYKKFANFIGPVGGWSFADREHFKDKKTYKVSLGKNILKADTAAIYSLSCVRALLE